MCKRIKVDSIEFCIRTDKEDLVDSKYEKVELRLYLNVCLYEKAEVRLNLNVSQHEHLFCFTLDDS